MHWFRRVAVATLCSGFAIGSFVDAGRAEEDLNAWEARAIQIPHDDPDLSLTLWFVLPEAVDDVPDDMARAHLQFFTIYYPAEADAMFEHLEPGAQLDVFGRFQNTLRPWRIGAIPFGCHYTRRCQVPGPNYFILIGEDYLGCRGDTLMTGEANVIVEYVDVPGLLARRTIVHDEPVADVRWTGRMTVNGTVGLYHAILSDRFGNGLNPMQRRHVIDSLSLACTNIVLRTAR